MASWAQKGRAILSGLFLDMLKEFAEVSAFKLSSHKDENGRPKYMIGLDYVDESPQGDLTRLWRVITSCYAVAEGAKLDLQEVEATALMQDASIRATIIASAAADPIGPTNMLKALEHKSAGLTAAQKRSAVNWIKSWTYRISDPTWEKPTF